MLDKCGEGTRYKYRKELESALVCNAVSVGCARLDECEKRESRPSGETDSHDLLFMIRMSLKCYLYSHSI